MPFNFTPIKGIDSDIKKALSEHRIKIGKNVIFEAVCYFGDAVTVGDNVVFSGDDRIGGHTVIEEGVRIGTHCDIGEGSFIGKGIVIGNDVSLPKRTYVDANRRVVNSSEDFTAVFSSAGKVESFFGSDRILMFDPEDGQDYETSLSFKEFLKKAKVRQRLRIKSEEKRNEFLKKISSLISILKFIENKKN